MVYDNDDDDKDGDDADENYDLVDNEKMYTSSVL
jgi:hypothetical protein